MAFSHSHNGGAYVRSARIVGNTTAETETNGAWLTRSSDKGIALSGKVIVPFTTTLAAGETLAVTVQIQDAVDASGTGAADYGQASPVTVVATGDSGGSTEVGCAEVDVDLGGAREFIRAQITVTSSASGTLAYNGVMLFFGDQRGPATQSPVNIASADAI